MSDVVAGPLVLLNASRELISRDGAGFGGAWSRAAAHLSRQALELALDQFWQAQAPGVRGVSMRAQLACLPSYLKDPLVAGRASIAWAALSGACHHHAYQLTPTAKELRAWLESVEALVTGLRDAGGVGT